MDIQCKGGTLSGDGGIDKVKTRVCILSKASYVACASPQVKHWQPGLITCRESSEQALFIRGRTLGTPGHINICTSV